MASFSASGKTDPPSDYGIIALEILVSSQGAKRGPWASNLSPTWLPKRLLLLDLLPVFGWFLLEVFPQYLCAGWQCPLCFVEMSASLLLKV